MVCYGLGCEIKIEITGENTTTTATTKRIHRTNIKHSQHRREEEEEPIVGLYVAHMCVCVCASQ